MRNFNQNNSDSFENESTGTKKCKPNRIKLFGEKTYIVKTARLYNKKLYSMKLEIFFILVISIVGIEAGSYFPIQRK